MDLLPWAISARVYFTVRHGCRKKCQEGIYSSSVPESRGCETSPVPLWWTGRVFTQLQPSNIHESLHPLIHTHQGHICEVSHPRGLVTWKLKLVTWKLKLSLSLFCGQERPYNSTPGPFLRPGPSMRVRFHVRRRVIVVGVSHGSTHRHITLLPLLAGNDLTD